MKLRHIILLTMISIIAVIIAVFAVFSLRQYERSMKAQVVSDCGETVDVMGKSVESLIMYMEDFSKTISLNESVRNAIMIYLGSDDEMSLHDAAALRKEFDHLSTGLFYSTSMIFNFDLYAGRDLIYSYHNLRADEEISVIPLQIIERALQTAAPIWTDLISLPQLRKYNKNDEYGFAVVKSVRDDQSKIIGFIAVYVKESSFASLLETKNVADQSCFLVNAENRIISATGKDTLGQNINEVFDLNEEEQQICMQSGMLLKEETGHVPALYIRREIEDENVALVCRIIMSDLALQTRSLRLILTGVAIAAVIIAFVGAGFASGYITRPLGRLTQVMEQIKSESGNGRTRYFGEGNGEIAQLGEQFNELMDQLDASREQIYQEQRQRRHNEVRLLQAQIVPHFLYNTLGMISSMLKLGMMQEAADALQQLASFYRLSLSNGKEVISIREEMELTRSYMTLQQLRYIEYMACSIDYDSSLGDLQIPKLTIQPLIENVLHHALRKDGRICHIEVNVYRDPEAEGMIIRVWDDGEGMPGERLEQLRKSLVTNESISGSFGVINIHQRLKLFFGDDYYMEISSEENVFTEFLLYLPVVKEKAKGSENV